MRLFEIVVLTALAWGHPCLPYLSLSLPPPSSSSLFLSLSLPLLPLTLFFPLSSGSSVLTHRLPHPHLFFLLPWKPTTSWQTDSCIPSMPTSTVQSSRARAISPGKEKNVGLFFSTLGLDPQCFPYTSFFSLHSHSWLLPALLR